MRIFTFVWKNASQSLSWFNRMCDCIETTTCIEASSVAGQCSRRILDLWHFWHCLILSHLWHLLFILFRHILCSFLLRNLYLFKKFGNDLHKLVISFITCSISLLLLHVVAVLLNRSKLFQNIYKFCSVS